MFLTINNKFRTSKIMNHSNDIVIILHVIIGLGNNIAQKAKSLIDRCVIFNQIF